MEGRPDRAGIIQDPAAQLPQAFHSQLRPQAPADERAAICL
jgi:hypothetical protein